MARLRRIDFPGALHHVIARGIERGNLFIDDVDRAHFVHRLAALVKASNLRCFAWALMPNHLHLLLQTHSEPLYRPMQRLLTEYAGWFNHRYDRAGHLFQNRYRSIACESGSYQLELIRYIHLNPVRAGLVTGLEELTSYPWTGHAALMSLRSQSWLEVDAVLKLFGSSRSSSRAAYLAYLEEGLTRNSREVEVPGKGQAKRGWTFGQASDVQGIPRSDPRILGSASFIRQAMRESAGADRRTVARVRLAPEKVLSLAARVAGVSVQEMKRSDRRASVVRGRRLACTWLVDELGIRGTAVARMFGITGGAVTQAVQRGRMLVTERGWQLAKLLKN